MPQQNMRRVWPTREAVAKYVQHPSVRKPLDMVKGGYWPNDQFTSRRLIDGDITDKKPMVASAPPKADQRKRARNNSR